jgi:hypothetical protein
MRMMASSQVGNNSTQVLYECPTMKMITGNDENSCKNNDDKQPWLCLLNNSSNKLSLTTFHKMLHSNSPKILANLAPILTLLVPHVHLIPYICSQCHTMESLVEHGGATTPLIFFSASQLTVWEGLI